MVWRMAPVQFSQKKRLRAPCRGFGCKGLYSIPSIYVNQKWCHNLLGASWGTFPSALFSHHNISDDLKRSGIDRTYKTYFRKQTAKGIVKHQFIEVRAHQCNSAYESPYKHKRQDRFPRSLDEGGGVVETDKTQRQSFNNILTIPGVYIQSTGCVNNNIFSKSSSIMQI